MVCQDTCLDGEEKCKDVAKSQHNRCAHRHDDAPWGRPVSILGLLAHMPAPACTCLARSLLKTQVASYTCALDSGRAPKALKRLVIAYT